MLHGVFHSCKVPGCTQCYSRTECILPLHRYWGKNWGRWPGAEQGEAGECNKSVGIPVDNRRCSSKEHRPMGMESGTLVGLAPCNRLKKVNEEYVK